MFLTVKVWNICLDSDNPINQTKQFVADDVVMNTLIFTCILENAFKWGK